MNHEFFSRRPVAQDAASAGRLRSTLTVSTPGNASVVGFVARVELDDVGASNLLIRLIAPDGTAIVLAERASGSPEDFRHTDFRSGSASPITDTPAPYRGCFRPMGDAESLIGKPASGDWTLEVVDSQPRPKGALTQWSLALELDGDQRSAFQIDLRLGSGLSSAQQQAFNAAAARWAEIIVGSLPPVRIGEEVIESVQIDAEGRFIDGPGQVLGEAGPTELRPGSLLPARGIMAFDSADLDQLEADNSLTDVILHEMGHVLGFGTLWVDNQLIQGAGSADPQFVGVSAMREYATLTNNASPLPVPVANTGGPGTRDGHWREAVLGDELLTGFISGNVRPLSRLSIAAFEDLGYEVDYAAADPYSLPDPEMLGTSGASVVQHAPVYTVKRTEPVILQPGAILV